MFKKIVLSAALLVSSLGMAGSVSEASPVKNNKTAIFYVPHQDDEILSMGPAILNHVEKGYNVHLVLITDGEGSRLANKMGMSKAEFGKARDREFRLSAIALKVKSNNVHFHNLPDGKVSVAKMRNIITSYETRFPGAHHKSISYHDNHADHRASGLALNELYNRGIVKDARFYVNHSAVKHPGSVERASAKSKPRVQKSIQAYTRVKPEWGYYGIGGKSVPTYFANISKDPKSIYHKPNQ